MFYLAIDSSPKFHASIVIEVWEAVLDLNRYHYHYE